jgi:GNAT superfamily N-acetyltransferase
MMLRVRKAMAGDCVGMWRIRTRAIRSISETHYPKASIEMWASVSMADDFADAFHQIEAVVCEHEGEIVGWGFADLAVSQIEAVFVDPTYFGRGVGRMIVEEFESHGSDSDLKSFELTSTLNAEPFYTKLGYQKLGETVFEHPAGFTLAAVRMGKALKA